MPHISLAAEKIATVWGFPISNSLVATWVVMGLLLGASWFVTSRLSRVPAAAQSIAEIIVGGLFDFFGKIIGTHTKQFFPLIASLFLFIITANWVGLTPGFGTIGFFVSSPLGGTQDKFVPLLRAATADLNTTLALAVVAVLAIQYFGFKTVGFRYNTRFFNFTSPIYFVMGVLELVSEVSKVVSFAFRLFGNIFAGEVLLAVMAFLMPFIVPLPFLAMELFVGFIQALVFSMLTAVFLNVAVAHSEENHG